MRSKLFSTIVATILLCGGIYLLTAYAKQKISHAQEALDVFAPQQDLAFAIGLQAYLYALPLSWMEYTMDLMTSQKGERNAPLGTFGHSTHLITPKDTDFIVTPNNDTIYSSAWIDLAKEPYVLNIPEIKDRYYSFAFIDAWSNVFKIVSSRTRGAKEGTFVIVGPGQKNVPSNFEKIEAPTNLVWILVRILVNSESDLPNVRELQDKFGLTPLSEYSSARGFKSVPQSTAGRYVMHKNIPASLQFFDQIGQYFVKTPPRPYEECLLSWFDDIGITKNGLELTEDRKSGLERVEAAAMKLIESTLKNISKKERGWVVLPIPDNFGTNYLLRACMAYKGLGGLPYQEALYPMCETDAEGYPLDGNHRYVIHFEKNQLPPVNGFWSLSLYSQQTFNFVENEINRYSIGDRTAGMVYNKDGSLDIYIQNKKPEGKVSNWLPAPTDAFYLVLRLYDPQPAVYDGTWQLPIISRQ